MSWRITSFLIVALILLLALILTGSSAHAGDRVAIVVNADRTDTITLETVAEIYLKKRLFWSNGKPIIPVNRDATSETRSLFTRLAFGDTARNLARYWNGQYILGVLPPATLASDEAVKRFVAAEPGAIGYIDASTVDDSVRAALYLGVR